MDIINKAEASELLGYGEEPSLYRVQQWMRSYVRYTVPIVAAVILLVFFSYCGVTAVVGPLF